MPPLSPEKPALCAGCGGKISDRYYLLAVDKQWHLRCLKCCECKLALESELTCFAKDGSIYCKEDYYRYGTLGREAEGTSPGLGSLLLGTREKQKGPSGRSLKNSRALAVDSDGLIHTYMSTTHPKGHLNVQPVCVV